MAATSETLYASEKSLHEFAGWCFPRYRNAVHSWLGRQCRVWVGVGPNPHYSGVIVDCYQVPGVGDVFVIELSGSQLPAPAVLCYARGTQVKEVF